MLYQMKKTKQNKTKKAPIIISVIPYYKNPYVKGEKNQHVTDLSSDTTEHFRNA